MRTINPDRTFALDDSSTETAVTHTITVGGPANCRIVPHTYRRRELAVDSIEVRFTEVDGVHVRTLVKCIGSLLYIGQDESESFGANDGGRSSLGDMPDWLFEVIEAAIEADVLDKVKWPHRVI